MESLLGKVITMQLTLLTLQFCIYVVKKYCIYCSGLLCNRLVTSTVLKRQLAFILVHTPSPEPQTL